MTTYNAKPFIACDTRGWATNTPLRRRYRSILMSAMIAYGLSFEAARTFAAVPHLVRYQGQAVDSNGVPLEGPYNLTVRLYDAETAGTQVWGETHPNVPLSGGHFSILLGQVTSLQTVVDWTQPLWLSVQVNTDPELTPRQRITSVPLAMRAEIAEQLEGPIHTTESNVGIGTVNPVELLEVRSNSDPTLVLGSTTAEDPNSGKISFREEGTSESFNIRFDGAANKLLIDTFTVPNALTIQRADGRVGIGTANPNSALDVNGTVRATTFVGDGSNLTNAGPASPVCTLCRSCGGGWPSNAGFFSQALPEMHGRGTACAGGVAYQGDVAYNLCCR